MEARLFALRLSLLSTQQAIAVLSRLGVEYEGEHDTEDADADSQSDGESDDWTGFHSGPRKLPQRRPPTQYRVPFEHAARLIKHRQVEMRRGFCLVPVEDMHHVAVHHYKAMLLRQMNVLCRSLLTMSSDETARLDPVLARVIASWQLEMVRQGSTSGGSSNVRARIKLNEIDSASDAHFPLCMRHLHRKFRENHHLKYDGRVQYRMFLKGLGLSVQESILFFRSEFVKVIPAARFDKEYAYHIRHSYGLEGARRDYAPFDCAQITNGPAPRHGQYHGCPFKHWDGETLRYELGRCGLPAHASSKVTTEAASGHHQSACRALFDATHRVPYAQAMAQLHETASLLGNNQVVQHPNAYVDASVAVATVSRRSGQVQRGQAEQQS